MDGIFGIGPLELFFIAIIALIVLGPERLPSVLREIAKTIRRLRELTSEFTNQFGDELKALDEINPRKILNDMVDPTKPLPGEKAADASTASSAANKPLSAPKPAGPKSQATANAILSSKAATDAARATKAAKEAEAAKGDAKALEAKSRDKSTFGTMRTDAKGPESGRTVSADAEARSADPVPHALPVTNGVGQSALAEPGEEENTILPPAAGSPVAASDAPDENAPGESPTATSPAHAPVDERA